ncbi:ester cyclase [Paraburkholderia sp. GAS348]|uniref:ester cyclase n=1 Tax=Paraburkholderia sp. GAS348 TaxID=3035132 RepID=UPI003D2452BE
MHPVRAHRPSSASLGYCAIAWTGYGSRSAQAPRFLLSISRRYASWRRRLRTTRVVTIATIRRVSVYRVLQQDPDLNFWGAANLIAEGDYVVGRWEGGGTHTGPAFSDFLVGSLPPATGRTMRFTGTTVLRPNGGKIFEEIGLDDGGTALQQLGLLKAA